MVAIVPRILIGVFPYFIYKAMKTRTGAGIAAFVGTATNTVLVLSFITLFLVNTQG